MVCCDIETHYWRHELHHTDTGEPCADCQPSGFVIKVLTDQSIINTAHVPPVQVFLIMCLVWLGPVSREPQQSPALGGKQGEKLWTCIIHHHRIMFFFQSCTTVPSDVCAVLYVDSGCKVSLMMHYRFSWNQFLACGGKSLSVYEGERTRFVWWQFWNLSFRNSLSSVSIRAGCTLIGYTEVGTQWIGYITILSTFKWLNPFYFFSWFI